MTRSRLGKSVRGLLELERAAIGTVTVSVSNALLVFAVSVLLARALGVEGRGRVAAHMVAISTSFALGSLGINYGAAFSAARGGRSRPMFRRVLTLGLLSLGATAAVSVVIEAMIREPSLAAKMWAVAGAVSTQAVSILLGWIQGSGLLKVWNGLRLVQLGGQCPLIVVLWLIRAIDVTTAVAAYTASQVVAFFLSWAAAKGTIQESADTPLPSLRSIWGYSGTVAVSATLYQVNQRWDQLLLSLFRRSADLGVYASSVTLAGVGVPLGAGFAQATFAEGLHWDPAARSRMTRRRLWAAVAVTSGCAILLTIFSRVLMRGVYGPEFERGAAPLIILSWGTVFLAANFVAAESLRSAGDARTPMWAEAAGAAWTIALLPLAIPAWGIVGAAAVSATSYAISFSWNVWKGLSRSRSGNGMVRQG